MGKRHRRIRARSATGQVAGAATEKPGLNTPIAQTGLPVCVLPKSPCPGPTSLTRPNPEQQPSHHFHAPKLSSRRLPESGASIEVLIGATPLAVRFHPQPGWAGSFLHEEFLGATADPELSRGLVDAEPV
jgi:hypothetical protein